MTLKEFALKNKWKIVIVGGIFLFFIVLFLIQLLNGGADLNYFAF